LPSPTPYRVRRVLAALRRAYPGARTALEFATPWQLLVATMLSAQCTDQRVNLITRTLFRDFPDARSLAALEPWQLEPYIRTCGLFRTKARHVIAAARLVVERYGGELPPDISRDALMTLPGVGRKTANVVLANAFGQPALAVDTHVFRVAHRLGWSEAKDPRGTEEDLLRIIPRRCWAEAHHWLILHGRAVCRARRPNCAACPVARWCPSAHGVAVRGVGSA
jgi:endonuclease-3